MSLYFLNTRLCSVKVQMQPVFDSLSKSDYDRNSRHSSKKFTFFLGATGDSIRQLLSNFTLSTLADSPAADSLTVSPLLIPTVTPSLKRNRMSKIDKYKQSTSERYSKAVMGALMICLGDIIPVINVSLRNQVLDNVVL